MDKLHFYHTTVGGLMVALVTLSISSCEKEVEEFQVNAVFEIKDSELVEKMNIVLIDGDGAAAYQIAQHYMFFENKSDLGTAWLKRASSLGSEDAKRELEARNNK